MTRAAVVTWVAIAAIIFAGFSIRKALKAKPVALEPAQKQAIADLLQLSKRIRGNDESTMVNTLGSRVAGAGEQGSYALAECYVLDGDYEKGVAKFQELSGTGSKDAKTAVHFRLGNIYYDLALLDMMNRRLFTQTRVGFIMPKPDERAKLVLAAAKKEFSQGADLAGTVPDEAKSRIAQLDRYLSDSPADAALMIDQADSSLWLTRLSKERPELLEPSIRALRSWRFVTYLQNHPPAAAPTDWFVESHDKRIAEIERCGDGAIEIKVIYQLACTVAFWNTKFTGYRMMAERQSVDPQFAQELKTLGKQIVDGAELLDLPLPPDATALALQLEGGMEALKSLLGSLESGLKSNYSPRCDLLYEVIANEDTLCVYLSSQQMIDVLGGRMIPAQAQPFARLARDCGADEKTQTEILALATEPVTTATADKITTITNRLFSKVLADIKQSDQWQH